MDAQNSQEIRFEAALSHSASPSRARVLGAAAALCLCGELGGEGIMWPGRVMAKGEEIAEVTYHTAPGTIRLTFRVNTAFARDGLEADVLRDLETFSADYPANSAEIMQTYSNRCMTLMKYVDTAYRGMPVYGFAFAVDKYNGLMVMTRATRSVVTVYDGAAELASDEPQQPDYPVMPRV